MTFVTGSQSGIEHVTQRASGKDGSIKRRIFKKQIYMHSLSIDCIIITPIVLLFFCYTFVDLRPSRLASAGSESNGVPHIISNTVVCKDDGVCVIDVSGSTHRVRDWYKISLIKARLVSETHPQLSSTLLDSFQLF